MPGAVNISAAPSVERFCAAKCDGIARRDLVRDARLAVRHLVVGFGVDHPAKRVSIVVMGKRVGDRRHVPRPVARRDQHLADRMHELRVPLGTEAGAAILDPRQ